MHPVTKERMKRFAMVNEEIFERTASAELQAYAKFPDLSLLQVQVIRLIEYHKPCNMSQLSKSMGLSLASTTQLMNRLAKKDYIKRVRSKIDQRVVFVELKAKGKKVINASRKHVDTVGLQVMKKFTPKEQDQMLDFFDRMIAK